MMKLSETPETDETPLTVMGEDCRVELDERDLLIGQTRKRRNFLHRCLCMLCLNCCAEDEPQSRAIYIGSRPAEHYPPNVIRNQKYSVLFFVPCVLINQFKFFLNLYFLILAVTQFFPAVRVGYLYTYWGPLGFVLLVTMCREAVDDFRRYQRDKEINGQVYTKLVPSGHASITSAEIKVGDLLYVQKNQRIPADLILLRTSEKSGTCFIRTDQLDGETDWKLRLPISALQKLGFDEETLDVDAVVSAEPPKQDIHSFLGNFQIRNQDGSSEEESLGLENTLWANTVLANGTALGLVVYTGRETRSVMNNSSPRSKVGLVDLEINFLTKILFGTMIAMSLVMVLLKGNRAYWYQYLVRFVLLFSYIIPLSLRVNLDMAKIFYSWSIMKDKEMPENVVRSTTIPEELGRIGYVLTDKTGTLTKNEMVMKKFHVTSEGYSSESFCELRDLVKKSSESKEDRDALQFHDSNSRFERAKARKAALVGEAVKAVALCHNVTPIEDDGESRTYQAASPDEIALVQWTEAMGMSLTARDLTRMTIVDSWGNEHHYEILMVFPFTSETKRMGIILRDEESDKIVFYLKGADIVMVEIIHYCDWLEEVVDMMANEGLRTLVVASKTLTKKQYQDFEAKYKTANMALAQRGARVASVVETLERDMELLCVTGVEDSLQDNIWMLTGDKLETAASIAKSSHLVGRDQTTYLFRDVSDRNEAHLELNAFRRKDKAALVITGKAFETCRQFYEEDLMELACRAPAVVVCRCAPTQKADVVGLVKKFSNKRTVAVGDGGNDVPMIQAADAGVGIVGKEGKQASLAADFSLTQFDHLGRLLLVHGRYSYLRTAALSQFIIHRGLIISVSQAVFSALFYYSSIALYHGILLIGYSTVYTNFPVFSLVLDKDVTAKVAMTYPELYKILSKGRSLSLKTFLIWAIVSLYQGSVILYGTLILFENDFIHVVLLSFSALVLTELLMVVLTVKRWHYLMAVAELLSLGIYVASIFIFPKVFDFQFMGSLAFYWKVATITSVACVPLFIAKYLRKKFAPPAVTKLSGRKTVWENMNASSKIKKAVGEKVEEVETSIAQALLDLESTSDLKTQLRELQITTVKEIDVPNRKALVVFVPFPQLKAYQKIQTRLVRELEKKFSGKHVVFVAQRKILPKPTRKMANKSKQKRPRSRTLTAVHEAILEDLVYPAEIVGKRIRIKLDGSRIIKVHLDRNQQTNVEHKVETFRAIYKRLTGKEVDFEFPEPIF
ncbi:unnamed protein product [Notodromas monacha]|uniref:Phospholipid-transporting ATPase n=1 Tax=Notodromas monacha TaxID=399045 RepID=A0A7R9BRH8_9CRUS|nr:unnamed protein product [Notodromas monacha]CAG0919422.1 unnamed protein product [Notodromas monacha]